MASSSIGAVMEVVNEDKNTMSMMTYMQREWKRGFRRKHRHCASDLPLVVEIDVHRAREVVLMTNLK